MYIQKFLLTTCSIFALVDGHGKLSNPKPTFLNSATDTTTYSGIIDGNKALPGENYNLSPLDNTIAFTKQFKKSTYKTLLDLINAQGDTGGECGITKADGDIQTLPEDGNIKWSLGSEGFVSSHEGPCEVWCDSKRVYENDNCARNIPDGTMPIEVSQCRGAKQLVFLWLALHTSQWQVYKNCVRLSDNAPTPSTSQPLTTQPTSQPNPTYIPTPTGSRTRKPSMSPSKTPTIQPTGSPQPSPQPSPSHQPTPQPTTSDKVRPYEQCGGSNFQGQTQCSEGFKCQKWSEHYSQCIPTDPTQNEVNIWGQCGGTDYKGPAKCKAGSVCRARNEFFSQCMPQL